MATPARSPLLSRRICRPFSREIVHQGGKNVKGARGRGGSGEGGLSPLAVAFAAYALASSVLEPRGFAGRTGSGWLYPQRRVFFLC
eukprot:1389745-Amorphochlora_amoeboformis.AAC.1